MTRIVISHHNTDFDALAAMIGVRILWPDFVAVASSSVGPAVRDYLALHRDWLDLGSSDELDADEVTDVIVVDTRDRSRLAEFEEFLSSADRIRVFDHHPAGSDDIDADEVIVEPVGASVTLLCERMMRSGIAPDIEQATLLMLGLYADTGGLSFPTTTSRDLRAGAFLRDCGASLPVVNRYLHREHSPEQQRLLVALMDDLNIVSRKGLRFGVAGCKTPERVDGAAEVVERLMALLDLDALVVVLKVSGQSAVQLIGRSSTRHVDVAEIARRWGGGGHPGAAAARTTAVGEEELQRQLDQHFDSLEIAAMTVADAMSSPVQTISHDTTLRELQKLLESWDVSGVPVRRDGELAGVVSKRDVRRAADRDDWEIPVSGFMSRPVVSASPGDSLEEALTTLTEEDVGRLPVVDDGKIVGIVTRSDILKRLYGDGGLRGGR